MRRLLFGLVCLLVPLPATAAAPGADAYLAVAARIDTRLAARWPKADFKPAPGAADAEFMRRVYLDVVGVIPPAFEVRDFLADPAPDKRRRLVERLLASPDHARHIASVWRHFLLEGAGQADPQSVQRLEAWLAQHVRAGAGYDRIVRELLTAPLSEGRRSDAPAPLAFYQVRGYRLEDLAAGTAGLFLGLELECARCHNHPFADWKRQQFWEFAAFFAEVRPGGERSPAAPLAIPGTSRRVSARFPDGTSPRWQPGDRRRAVLAKWVVGRENPYFARAAVNRLWTEFFGVRLVEDLDPLGAAREADRPAWNLLDDLARAFVEHRFDVKFLIRALTASRAYQRTSRLTHPAQKDPRLFARMTVRGLSPEQLTASVARAAGYRGRHRPAARAVGRGVAALSYREEFQAGFAGWRSRAGSQTTALQALLAMNGGFIAEAVSLERGETLAAVAGARGLDAAGRVEQLFLATLSRRPRPDERDRLARYVRSGGPRKDPRAALGDVFWALLNSAEFMLNH
jgi:hypothetical protein